MDFEVKKRRSHLFNGTALDNEISHFDIEEYFKNEPKFLGTFSIHDKKIPALSKINQFVILNLGDYNSENPQQKVGTHWILLYRQSDDKLICFDSFGVVFGKSILEYSKKIGVKNILWQNQDLQQITKKNCGFFSMFVADKLLNGDTFQDIIYTFQPTGSEYNDNIL